MADEINKILKDENELKKKAREAIGAMDKNGDGKVDLKELKAYLISVCKNAGVEPKFTDVEIKQIFDGIDIDKSGKITEDEMANLIREILKGTAQGL